MGYSLRHHLSRSIAMVAAGQGRRTWGTILAAVLGFGLGLASAAQAEAVLYECDLTTRDPGVDWISAKYGFVVEGESVSVVDRIILSFAEEPVAAQVRARGSELRLTWTVLVRDADQNTARMSYRAWLNTDTKTATVRVRPIGIPQGWSGSGTCAARRA